MPQTDEPTKPPVSPARSAAARANGAKSRGPTSTAGKLNSRRNALVHGLTAKVLTLDRESDDRFIQILAALEAQLNPQNELEEELVEVIAYNRWRTMRTWSQEKAILDTAMSEARRAATDGKLRAAECGGIALRNLADQSRVLAIIDRNETRYQRFYHRALRELFTLRDRESSKTNPPSPTKHSQSQKTNPANPGPSDLMKDWIPSDVLEARIAAYRAQKPAGPSSVPSAVPL